MVDVSMNGLPAAPTPLRQLAASDDETIGGILATSPQRPLSASRALLPSDSGQVAAQHVSPPNWPVCRGGCCVGAGDLRLLPGKNVIAASKLPASRPLMHPS